MSIDELKQIIKETPNDMELGSKLREWYWGIKKNKQ